MLDGAKVLVLDVSFQPLGYVNWRKAVTLWYEQKVEIIKEYSDLWIHSQKLSILVPSVIRFVKNVIKRVRKVRFSRDGVYLRDKSKCQYCCIPTGRSEFTIDHVIPKSRGGKTEWTNCVVSCVNCNRDKANRTPEEAGMCLKTTPIKPKTLFQQFTWLKTMPSDWKDFLLSAEYWNGELLDQSY